MLWEWRGIANMAFIQLGGNSRVDEMILARVSSGFAGENLGKWGFVARNSDEEVLISGAKSECYVNSPLEAEAKAIW
ncbi:hypothetical protein Tco_0890270 [Tanacetum coccineum]|uniref:Uncharacterized protein n=1 Tax=Tanacetum coccineum TaxID=301880 RepID=A0ABQ5C140_9ASTR